MSPNLTYRLWSAGDGHQLGRAWADPDVAAWTSVPTDSTVEAAERWVSTEAVRRTRGLAIDIVFEHDGELAGEVGFSDFSRARRAALVGYWVHSEHRGQGFASEALQAVGQWAAGAMGLRLILAVCDSANVASIAVARRAGYVPAGTDPQGNQVLAAHLI